MSRIKMPAFRESSPLLAHVLPMSTFAGRQIAQLCHVIQGTAVSMKSQESIKQLLDLSAIFTKKRPDRLENIVFYIIITNSNLSSFACHGMLLWGITSVPRTVHVCHTSIGVLDDCYYMNVCMHFFKIYLLKCGCAFYLRLISICGFIVAGICCSYQPLSLLSLRSILCKTLRRPTMSCQSFRLNLGTTSAPQ